MAGTDIAILIAVVIGIVFLIMYLITFFAILNIRDNTEETNVLLRKLVDSQDSNTTVTLKRNKNLLDENTKTQKFIDALEKADKKDGIKEFTAIEKD
jgi:hypothetical protein